MKDYSFFCQNGNLSNWLCSIGEQYESYRSLFKSGRITAAELFEESSREEVFAKFFEKEHVGAISRAIDCIKAILSKNPLTWNSFETSEFLYTLGSSLWHSVWSMKNKGFTVSRVIFFTKEDAILFEEVVPNISHRNTIVSAIELICNPSHWSQNSLQSWFTSLGSEFIPIAERIQTNALTAEDILTKEEEHLKALFDDEKMRMRVYFELIKLGKSPNWAFDSKLIPNSNSIKESDFSSKKDSLDKPTVITETIIDHSTPEKNNPKNKSFLFQNKMNEALRKSKMSNAISQNTFERSTKELKLEISDCASFDSLEKVLASWHAKVTAILGKNAHKKFQEVSEFPGQLNSTPFFAAPSTQCVGFGNSVFPVASPAQTLVMAAPQSFGVPYAFAPPAYMPQQPPAAFFPARRSNAIPIVSPQIESKVAKTPLLGEKRAILEDSENPPRRKKVHLNLFDEIVADMKAKTRLLIYGETDFSFSYALCKMIQQKIQNITLEGLHMTVASEFGRSETIERYSFSQNCIESIECHWETVGVKYGAAFSGEFSKAEIFSRYDHIVWTLPIVNEANPRKKSGAEMVQNALRDIERLLSPKGKVWITLCSDEAARWRLGETAEGKELLLVSADALDFSQIPDFICENDHDHDCLQKGNATNFLFVRNP